MCEWATVSTKLNDQKPQGTGAFVNTAHVHSAQLIDLICWFLLAEQGATPCYTVTQH